MIRSAILKIVAIIVFTCTVTAGRAGADPVTTAASKTAAKPYKVVTAGKRITVRCKTAIAKIMVWTSKGQRIVEEDNVNTSSYSFDITIREKFFFMMLELQDGKRYTEKIGIAE